jgi:NAD(P)-dependent dehydrogenase (short-subunit alcohol dehydrogenase family)
VVNESFIDEMMNVNFKDALFAVQKAVPLMGENSSIVFNTSINNQMGMPNSGIYATSKAALRALRDHSEAAHSSAFWQSN